MIPILYDKDETTFITNGLGRLRDCISCIVTEERNGIYECDFEYPMNGANYDMIQIGRIIAVTHDDTNDIQPFDIVSYEKTLEGTVLFHAVHISYRQSYMTVKGTSINSLADAFTLLGTATPSNPFAYSTDKTSSGYLACADGIPKTVRQMLGGVEGSILDVYGGEYEWDRFNVTLHSARGKARGFTIRYGVNMLEYEEEYDSTNAYSSCIPYWTDGTTTVVGDKQTYSGTLPSGRDSCVPLDVSDRFESKPTKAQVNSMGLSVMNSQKPTLPEQNITVSFVRLQDMGEYAVYDSLMQCRLCDSINIVFPDYSTVAQSKIVVIKWDVLQNKYDSMELGTLSTSLSEALGITNSAGNSASGSSELTQKTVTSSSTTVSANSTSTITETFTLTSPYSKVAGVRGIYTSNNSNCTVSAFSVSGDGAIGNTVTLTAYIFNKSSSSRSITVTWDLMLSG